jgi:hypothetical protein
MESMMNYGMFTDEGNRVVDGIVIAAKELGWSFGDVYRILSVISRADGLSEATDTAVREYVYEALENS